jgi:methyltransferase (TIGR00027 family)
LDAIAKTAYYCCGVRAADAAGPRPICGDQFAQRFMNDEARAVFAGFSTMTAPNASNVSRARIIDDWLRARLKERPETRVILLGAGFDSRAFRLDGGRWVELDQPAIIERKDAVLPATEAANPLVRIAIDFAADRLADKLEAFAGESPVVVMEGVSMYLAQDRLKANLATLHQVFPQHTLICDLMTATFRRRYGRAIDDRIRALGGSFAELVDDPAAAIVACGYRETERASMVGRARELGALKIPGFLLATFLRSLRDGFTAHIFETTSKNTGSP